MHRIVHKFNIRQKLALFLVVPFFGLLFLSAENLYNHYSGYEDSKQSLQTLETISQLSDLIHAIQKERGLTAGYLGSGRKEYQTELALQQKRVNQKIQQLKSSFDLLEKTPLCQKKLAGFNLFIQKLKPLRQAVKTGDPHLLLNKSFNQLTQGIALISELIDSLQIKFKEDTLMKLGFSFHNLLYIQEYAGQERGLLTQVFSNETLSINVLTEVNTAIALQNSLINQFLHMATPENARLLKSTLTSPDLKAFNAIRQSALNKFYRLEYLNQLSGIMGYGGFIHSFKNYVIRGEAKYATQVRRQMMNSLKILNSFQKLPGLGDSDKKYILDIELTLRAYALNLNKIKQMHERYRPIKEIDERVRVNDERALNAIMHLKQSLNGVSVQQWWSVSTARIDKIYAVQLALLAQMQRTADKVYQDSVDEFFAVAFILLLTLALSIYLAVVLARRVVFDIVEISEKMQYMLRKGDYSHTLPMKQNDEISDLAASFNELIRERNKYESEILWQANYDGLTGLPNRNYCMELLQNSLNSATRQQRTVSIMFIDLDHFKFVNDTLGHQVGDKLLKEVANKIKGCLRSSDILARLGGDEFVLICPDQESPYDAEITIKRIMETLKTPFADQDLKDVTVTLSVGITVFPQDGTQLTDLIRNADTAMYEAKASGKDAYRYFTSAMNEVLEHKNRLEIELKSALENHEFVLHYQPIYNVITQKVVAVEALIRWQHPTRGLVFPDEFISVAEETNLIIPIGDWVIEEAIGTLAKFNQEHQCKVELSINVSSKQCLDKFQQVTEQLVKVVEASHFDFQFVHLEITESILLDHSADMIKAMEHLVEMGVKFHLDDFGTGYSSLSYLKEYPMDILKIDRAFIKDIPSNVKDVQLVQAIVFMADGLGLGVIAEGVETQQQLEFLQQMGCELIQGYYISRPISFNHCSQLILETNQVTT